MSKKAANGKKSFNYTASFDLPRIPVKETWDLKAHYYKSEKDPQIEKDAKAAEREVAAFVRKYRNKDFTGNTKKLLRALKDHDALAESAYTSKIIRYFGFRTTLNTNDNIAQKKLALFSDRFRKLGNELLFFSLTLGKIPKNKQRQYLKEKVLEKYHYFLKEIFETAKHDLTEPEERILSLRSNTSCGMWADAVEKILSNRSVKFQKKDYKIPEALEQVDLQSWENKTKLWQSILTELQQISEVAEHELTAIVTHKKISDELRKYSKPYSATVQSYENNEQSVEALVSAISNKGFKLSQKFYKLKAKLHGKTQIGYEHKYHPIGDLIGLSFDEAVTICRDTFYSVGKKYGEIFDTMLQSGQIDVFPKSGKSGGAFCAGTVNLPTYVMLNHVANFKSLETLAHEMGHAIHSERSKQQPAIYEGYSTVTAETASTLFEQLVLDRVFEQLTDEQRVIFLHDKISRDIATIQRQICFFNYELDMHNNIRREGAMTKEELAAMMQKHLKAYLGPAVNVTELDGYSYVYIPHLRYGFYVYSYTYGHLMSNLMASKYRKNPDYLEKIDQFLSAGGSDTVENIFSAIGFNTRKINTFMESLKTQEEEIALLEKLTLKQKK